MSKQVNGKTLNKYDSILKADIEKLMQENDVNFSAFISILRPDMPDKSAKDYMLKYRAEYLKVLRASLSVEEVKNILAVVGQELKFYLKCKEVTLLKYALDDVKVKYTELMQVCEMFGIVIKWEKTPMQVENTSNSTAK